MESFDSDSDSLNYYNKINQKSCNEKNDFSVQFRKEKSKKKFFQAYLSFNFVKKNCKDAEG